MDMDRFPPEGVEEKGSLRLRRLNASVIGILSTPRI